MANSDYMPRPEGDFLAWLANFQLKLPTHGPTVGLTAGEITTLSDICTAIVTAINNAIAKRAEAQAAVADKDSLKEVDVPILRNAIKRIKTHAGYTDGIGEDLKVIGSEEAVSDKPTLKAKAKPNFVDLGFTKKGFDGVNIYARLRGQSTWTFLARDTQTPYHDTRALATPGTPETREYQCIGVIADEEVGEMSDIVSVVFAG